MTTHLHVSVLIPWLTLTLTLVSICRGDVRDIVTEDIFNKILFGDITSSPVVVGEIATQDIFDAILSGASDNCTGKNFYTYSDFIDATRGFSEFGTSGKSADHKREIAAFFAIVAYVTSDLCYVEAINKSKNCDSSCTTQYPCTNGKQYYGRGPIQLTWNCNYGAAGDYLGINLLENPEIVAHDDLTAWKTALWFWNVNSNCHIAITSGQGFGATIEATIGGNCNGGNSKYAVNIYTNYCSQLGVDPGSNLSC